MTSSEVQVTRQGPVTLVTIDRQQARNAVDRVTAQQLADAFRDFDADPEASVAVLQGAHGTFCAGADLKALNDDARSNRATESNRRNKCGRETSSRRRKQLAHERDPCTKFTSESEACDEAKHFILPHVGDERIQDVRNRVHKNRSEERLQPTELIAEHSKRDAACEHSCELQIEQVLPETLEFSRVRNAERLQARDAQNREEHDVEEIDEITERRHDDRKNRASRDCARALMQFNFLLHAEDPIANLKLLDFESLAATQVARRIRYTSPP